MANGQAAVFRIPFVCPLIIEAKMVRRPGPKSRTIYRNSRKDSRKSEEADAEKRVFEEYLMRSTAALF